jgi:hypothetical protein
MPASGWMGATCSRLARAFRLAPTMSGDFSRSNARGVGATCPAPPTQGRPKRMKAPARSAPDENSVFAFPSERRLSPRSDLSLGVLRADRRAWLAACENRYRNSSACSVGCVQLGDRQARIFRQESEGGIRRRMWKLPGGKSGWRCCLGLEPSVRAAGMHGVRFEGSHHGLVNGGCCERGEPAEALFDATARNNPHEYSDGSLRESGHGTQFNWSTAINCAQIN